MLENTMNIPFLDLIKALPCFQLNSLNNTIEIKRIEEGHSSYCFNVFLNKQRYFVKYVKQEVEVNSEIIASIYTSSAKLSPRVVYSDQHWLVCEYIEGTSLACHKVSINEKITICISLMKQCHKINSELAVVDIIQIITEFCKYSRFTKQQQKILLQVLYEIENIDIKTIHKKQTVLCHGDLNFSNVLVSKKSWLFDFECACSGEIEFDLAMFFAINELTTSQQHFAIKVYCGENLEGLNKKKLNSYLKTAYILNGLWYLNRSRFTNNVELENSEFNIFEQKGLKQLSLFDERFQLPIKLVELMR